MTREETLRVLMTLDAAYPSFEIEDRKTTLEVWHAILEEYPYDEVMAAVKFVIKSDMSNFAPSVGKITNTIQELRDQRNGMDLNEMEAWALVSRALRDSTYHAQERFDELPPVIRKAVGSPENLRNWAVTDAESVENVIMSNFQRTYRTVLVRERQTNLMPTELRQAIERKQQGLLE